MKIIYIDISSPSNSGNVTPSGQNQYMFIDDQELMKIPSPQNISGFLNPFRAQKQSNIISFIDIASDYIVRQWIENPHNSIISNHSIISEALSNRIKQCKSSSTNSFRRTNTLVLVPVKINDEDGLDGNSEVLDITANSKLQIGTLELYFGDSHSGKAKRVENNAKKKLDLSLFNSDGWLNTLGPIFNLLRDIILNETKNDIFRDNSDSKTNESVLQMNESKNSITASFLEANKKTNNDALICFSQTTKINISFSQLLNQSSLQIPKILQCDKALVMLIVETPNSNILGGPTKTAYFHSFADNHTYNFNYEGTFIDKILAKSSGFTLTTNTHAFQILPDSIKSPMPFQYPKNISNELYHTIRYCPISIMIKGHAKVIAILETSYTEDQYHILMNSEALCINEWDQKNAGTIKQAYASFNKSASISQNDNSYISDIMEEDEKLVHMLDQNVWLLSGFADACGKSELEERKVSPEFKNMEAQCTKIVGKRLSKHIKNIHQLNKAVSKGIKKLERFSVRKSMLQWIKFDRAVKGMKVEDYQRELDNQSRVIRELKKQNQSVHQDLENARHHTQEKRHIISAAQICAKLFNKTCQKCKYS